MSNFNFSISDLASNDTSSDATKNPFFREIMKDQPAALKTSRAQQAKATGNANFDQYAGLSTLDTATVLMGSPIYNDPAVVQSQQDQSLSALLGSTLAKTSSAVSKGLGVFDLFVPTDIVASAQGIIGSLSGAVTDSPGAVTEVTGPPAFGNTNPLAPGTLVWPFGDKNKKQFQRVDQGWDLVSTPTAGVLAIAAGTLGKSNPDPGGFGNDYPYVILDVAIPDAPSDTIYYGHTHLIPGLIGKHVVAGQLIAYTNTTDPQNGSAAPAGWLEIGFARHGTGGPASPGSGVTPAGNFMYNMLINVDVVGTNPTKVNGAQ